MNQWECSHFRQYSTPPGGQTLLEKSKQTRREYGTAMTKYATNQSGSLQVERTPAGTLGTGRSTWVSPENVSTTKTFQNGHSSLKGFCEFTEPAIPRKVAKLKRKFYEKINNNDQELNIMENVVRKSFGKSSCLTLQWTFSLTGTIWIIGTT